jgi:L-2-aminoadipate reductase
MLIEIQTLREDSVSVEPLEKIRSCLKIPVLFRFAAFLNTRTSSLSIADATAVDLVLSVTLSSNGDLGLNAQYNQRLFSSARISVILSQLFQLLENASTDIKQAIGTIDFLTNQQRAFLPDPTRDLGWSSFRGAIHDIFSANAEAYPDRLCVVETKSGASPERTFTYQQIHEASNILAHHLVQSGVKRGEVVMVYSHRGVDLVVAVMGILKAGATFSVLDPAYPPDRQNIYLEVSQPKALIIIDKATKEAGELSEKVRSFVDANLALRTEIAALALRDDGTLLGGARNGTDVFEGLLSLKVKSPGVIVGPDSTPTLSFTSGSEGKPKGVRGRHFSLAYYFDWMAETFNLSANDRFTMLSGIAHDPIQRDMFTPLFLGAQLLVPSKEDIQNERLAEWMKAHGPTVTHLTPAMGQILVGGASARFEKLHHAFFVGDILIKRDCRSLQSLAPNVSIVNMYGTTETQRAVSYFEIPSFASQEGYLDGMKDVIPAGKGMHNVQLLVVNRHDRRKICAVGEVGEIYVRAGGLAEGYLGTPELTEKKFLQNWFVSGERWEEQDRANMAASAEVEPWREFYLGPRDRLYRSGDLGRYTPIGDVECSGRADDQVKIRGFRIELGEIDTHLSQHPLIRENVTLVRRDKFEEQTLVSYVVPNIKEWSRWLASQGLEDEAEDESMSDRIRRFRPLQKEIQSYLQGKLPAYAVPSVMVPMRSMPLNPNGKIDKPKLPFPDSAAFTAGRHRRSSVLTQLSETELNLAHIWAKLIPGLMAKTLKAEDSFFELGGNSMHAQQLPFFVRRQWRGVDISISKIYCEPTLKSMAATVDQAASGEPFDVDTNNEHLSNGHEMSEKGYAEDATALTEALPGKFPSSTGFDRTTTPVVFLTGATGFLGAYILRDLFERQKPAVKVVALVRAKSSQTAMERIKVTCKAYGVWSEDWVSRLQCVAGSLGDSQLGLSLEVWDNLAEKIDVVIHNGAQVHWINSYASLKPSNVLGTIDALKLCATGKPKKFAFVSSTSVVDTDYFVFESERIIAKGGEGISEADDLSGSRTGLGTGYGQSKWVAEYLVREAGKRGLQGSIVRPGYVTGDSRSGGESKPKTKSESFLISLALVNNTDDFLIRMMKGCIQLARRPNINNTVNMVPVDHVARVVVACSFRPPTSPLGVAHVTGHPRLRFNQFLAALETYGYDVPLADYIPWTGALENYVNNVGSSSDTQLALMPLFTFVANDLPSNTRAPELDDANAEKALYEDQEWTGEDVSEGSGVAKNTIGLYLAYLVAIGFLPPPTKAAPKALPSVKISSAQREALSNVGGRGAAI